MTTCNPAYLLPCPDQSSPALDKFGSRPDNSSPDPDQFGPGPDNTSLGPDNSSPAHLKSNDYIHRSPLSIEVLITAYSMNFLIGQESQGKMQ